MKKASTAVSSDQNSTYYAGEEGIRTFKMLRDAVQDQMKKALAFGGGVLFSIETEGLWERYLSCYKDPVERQYHNCNCCRSFIKHYGGLVAINSEGQMMSAIWDGGLMDLDMPDQYRALCKKMKDYVERQAVETRYIWDSGSEWGTFEAGGFHHLWMMAPPGRKPTHLTPGQEMANSRQDREHLEAALKDMKLTYVSHANMMLKAGSLVRPENLLPMGEFLQNVHEKLDGVRPKELRNRLFWYFVGQAAPGWCTPRGSAFGALVFDIAEDKQFAVIQAAHNARMDPLQYQRPQAPPAAGNIAQAERIFEQLDLATSLRRRPMALEEAETIWDAMRGSVVTHPTAGRGTFAHLKTKDEIGTPQLASGAGAITFAKFRKTILPSILKLRFKTPFNGNYAAFTTAVIPTSRPLLKWDSEERRNQGAWYLYSGGSGAASWGLPAETWVDVLAIAKLPPDWYGNESYNYTTVGRVLLILKNAADHNQSGLAIFPECVRNDLHVIRSTIEAHSRSKQLEPEYRQRASGYMIGSDSNRIHLEATTRHGIAHYLIDRLE